MRAVPFARPLRSLQTTPSLSAAFQATFLVLFRRAAALDRSGSVANWLSTVAYRVALRARVKHEVEVSLPRGAPSRG